MSDRLTLAQIEAEPEKWEFCVAFLVWADEESANPIDTEQTAPTTLARARAELAEIKKDSEYMTVGGFIHSAAAAWLEARPAGTTQPFRKVRE